MQLRIAILVIMSISFNISQQKPVNNAEPHSSMESRDIKSQNDPFEDNRGDTEEEEPSRGWPSRNWDPHHAQTDLQDSQNAPHQSMGIDDQPIARRPNQWLYGPKQQRSNFHNNPPNEVINNDVQGQTSNRIFHNNRRNEQQPWDGRDINQEEKFYIPPDEDRQTNSRSSSRRSSRRSSEQGVDEVHEDSTPGAIHHIKILHNKNCKCQLQEDSFTPEGEPEDGGQKMATRLRSRNGAAHWDKGEIKNTVMPVPEESGGHWSVSCPMEMVDFSPAGPKLLEGVKCTLYREGADNFTGYPDPELNVIEGNADRKSYRLPNGEEGEDEDFDSVEVGENEDDTEGDKMNDKEMEGVRGGLAEEQFQDEEPPQENAEWRNDPGFEIVERRNGKEQHIMQRRPPPTDDEWAMPHHNYQDFNDYYLAN